MTPRGKVLERQPTSWCGVWCVLLAVQSIFGHAFAFNAALPTMAHRRRTRSPCQGPGRQANVLTSTPTHSARRFPQRANTSIPKPHQLRRTKSVVMASSVVGLAGEASSASLAYMALLAVQFGTQPILTQKYAGKDSKIVKRTYVGVQDLARIAFCLLGLALSSGSITSASVLAAVAQYRPALHLVLFPAALYALQNYCSLTAYQSLDPITYNVLNQTKTIAAAVWCYVLLRQPQSLLQVASLVLLVVAALVMENHNPFQLAATRRNNHDKNNGGGGIATETRELGTEVESPATTKGRQLRRTGLIAILTASMTSGLAGAWTQRCLQAGQRPCNSLVFSMELSLVSFVLMIASAVVNPAAESLEAVEPPKSLVRQLFQGWTAKTWIPVITNALGGILVGLVTKHAGVVPKGFALILGLFLGGVLQNLTLHTRVTPHQWIGGSLAALSLWMHAAFPPQP